MSRRLDVLVTVGMGPYPFDRLISALEQIAHRHDVFAQIGTSSIVPPCEHERFVSFDELQERLRRADVVVTHAGNTVRIVQSMGRVPIAVARQFRFGEMANDHQVTYLERERLHGPVVALDDVSRLGSAVEGHIEVEARMLIERASVVPIGAASLVESLDRLLAPLVAPSMGRRWIR